MEQHLEEILVKTEGVPILAFVDPFGLGLPFSIMTGRLMGRTKWNGSRRIGPPTEVLLNLVRPAIYRSVGYLDVRTTDPTQLKVAASRIEALNLNLGGDWWQSIVRSKSADSIAELIRNEYIRRVLEASGTRWRAYRVAVSDTPRDRSVYDLVLFTQHEQGVWFFNDSVSLARKVFETYWEDGLGFFQSQLWDPEDQWVAEISANIQALYRSGEQIRVIDHMYSIYGETLGRARGIHVKQAVARVGGSWLLDRQSKCRAARTCYRAGPDSSEPIWTDKKRGLSGVKKLSLASRPT